MVGSRSDRQCPDDLLEAALLRARTSEVDALEGAAALLRDFDADARLHFLHGSLLAGERRYTEAADAMARAVELAPDNPIMRFQHGFLELSSGHAERADQIWQPLSSLEDGHPLRLFAEGLRHLVRDEFAEAAALLERGITRNVENAPLNDDMRLILTEIGGADVRESAKTPSSSVQALLQQYATRATRH
ncbi:MAG: hypothetical protein H7X93_14480 [Sphingomonadaceae bacterium]|nr:hypothetical protein [Sphingomonadaceae bacterium]